MNARIGSPKQEGTPVWLVVIDRPYYPSVEEFETREQAEEAAREVAAEEDTGGTYTGMVYVAEVLSRQSVKTDH